MANEPDKVNSGALAVILVLVAFTTLVVALVVTALVRQETTRLQAEGDLAQERPLRQLRAEQDGKLNASAAWVDKEAGIARVPLSSAMEMVLEAIRENPLALSPGNEPPEEAEEEELTEEEGTAEEEAVPAEEGTTAVDAPTAPQSAVPTQAVPTPAAPTPAPPAPAPQAAPAPQNVPAPAPAPAPQKAPAPAPPAPAPTGPAE